MPIYEYCCPNCHKIFEEWIASHDMSPHKCPNCGRLAPHIVSDTSFQLKGSGWYVTEYGHHSGDSSYNPPKDHGGKVETPASDSSEHDAKASGESKESTPPASSPASDTAGSTKNPD